MKADMIWFKIVENVMGWQISEIELRYVRKSVDDIPVKFDPLNNIADAWLVVEKMTREWPDYSISTDGNGWMVSWGFDGYGWPDVTAETAPLAICLAALKAVGVEVDGV